MPTPYQILDVECDACDITIKQAYLQKVKENPPDRDQELFQQIHAAYLLIKDNKSRMSYALFTFPSVDFDELIDQALHTNQDLSFSPQQFNKLLRASLDDTTLLNAFFKLEK